MTTDPKPQPPPPSRLDPEAMPRRDFLGKAAAGTACATCAFALLGAMRLPRAAVLPTASKKFKVAIPEGLAPGAPLVPPGRAVAIFRDAAGVHAISTVCTHLGCIVMPTAQGFDCPCHGSKFGPDGAVLRGPAPKSLPWLAVRSAGGGAVIVDEGKEIPPGTKETL